jgi:putative flippase GtrA
MQDNNWKKYFFKIALKYGLTGAILNIVALVVLYQIGSNPIISNTLSGMLVLILFVFFAVKEFRDVYNHKQLHFWQGLLLGTATYLIIAIVSAGFYYLYLSYFDQELLITIKEVQRSFLASNESEMVKERGEDWFRKNLEMIDEITVADLAWDDFLRKAGIGVFVTIIISVILRRVPKEYLK